MNVENEGSNPTKSSATHLQLPSGVPASGGAMQTLGAGHRVHYAILQVLIPVLKDKENLKADVKFFFLAGSGGWSETNDGIQVI